MARSIQSPGVEIFEKDLTLSPILPAGTNIFMTGFATKGPCDEVLQITSVQELEQVYGTPTNPAERYFYYGARQILNSSNGNLFVSRMPYGEEGGEGYGSRYGALVYPVVSVSENSNVQKTRNTKPIDKKYLQLNTVVYELSTSPTLSAQLVSLTANGIVNYEKYTTTEGASFVTGLNNYYTANITVPSNSAVALEAQALTGFFVDSNETVVSTDLTRANSTFVLGAPKFFDLTLAQYQGVIDGSGFTNTNSTWSASSSDVNSITGVADFGKAGLIIVNKIQSTINNRFEGHYVGIADNTNLLANTDHTSIRKIYTTGSSAANGLVVGSGYIEVPTSKLAFPLSASTDSGNNRNSRSLSEILEKVSDAFADMSTDKFDDTVSFGVFKLRTSPYNPDAIKLDFAFEDARTGSFDFYRQINDQNGGIANTFYMENVANKSNNVVTFINSNINGKNSGTWLDAQGIPTKQVRVFSHNSVQMLKDSFESNYSKFGFHINDVSQLESIMDYADALFPAGCFSTFTTNGKSIGSLPLKIDRTLRKVENDEIFPLDLVVEAGLGTIYATACANHTDYYDDTQISSGLSEGLNAMIKNDLIPPTDDRHNVRDNYSTIFQLFANFCENLRKDCMFIADPLRQIFVTGANSLVMSDTTRSFSQYIYNPLRHLFGTANTSYATTYGNWIKINDMFAGMNIWVPFSPFAASDMANVDQNFEPWYAPAGFIRGKVTNALALAINPSQKNRDMMYKVSVNPVAFFPNDGFNIFGQKTLLRQPSAFDRINVRRLFLYLEKATKRTVKYFVFEPNTMFTRNRVVSVLSPIFERAKNTQGLYDYIILCNTSNNTPTVIDQNELVVDIYLKPVRSAEFILVNFYATSTGANLSELIAQ
jgi:hypothetical protein